jgi:hypothetical protein
MRRVLGVALAVGLAGCAASGASTATGPVCAADVVDRPFVGGLLGLSLDPQIAEENTRRRQEARANQRLGARPNRLVPSCKPPLCSR